MVNKRLINTGEAVAPFDPLQNFETVTYTGNGGTQKITGYIRKGAAFNGSSSLVSASGFSVLTQFSLSFWINTTTTANQIIFQFDDGSNVNANSIQTNAANSLNIYPYNTSGGAGALAMNATDAATIYDGNWHHFVYTTDGTTELMYLDGSSVSTTKYDSYTTTARTTANLRLGSRRDGYGDFNGKLDQVRIFDKVLSSIEVTTLYNETYASSTKSTTDIFGDGLAIALYELDEDANDTAGAGTNGKFGDAAFFNGSSSKIVATNSINQQAFSVSFWFKYTSTNDYSALLGFSSDTNNKILVNVGAGATIGEIGIDAVNSGTRIFNPTRLTGNNDGQWHHCVLAWDGTTNTNAVKLYIDTVSTSDTSSIAASSLNSFTQFTIGDQNTASSSYFNGQIDDVRIYSYALTATEVGYIYNNTTASIPTDYVAYYKLDGNATDETGSYDGTATNVSYGYNGTPTNVNFLGMAFQPDLVWIKGRDSAWNHLLYDSVRGAQKELHSNTTDSEGSDVNILQSFNTNGFTLGSSGEGNFNGQNYVAWCWKAGATAVSNTDGTITSQVSANQGFSIVKWTTITQNDTAYTVGHGLSSAPDLIIVKDLDLSIGWHVYSSAFPNPEKEYLQLNSSNALYTNNTNIWNNTAATSSVWSMKSGWAMGAGNDCVAYCFHSVDGYQKIGSYTGNGTTYNKITTGFQPRFLLVKQSDASRNWNVYDNLRVQDRPLFPNLSNAEAGDAERLSFDSDGFTWTNSAADFNASGGTYIYLAIA